MGRKIGCERGTAIRACEELVARRMLIKTVDSGKFGNHYKINCRVDDWFTGIMGDTGSVDDTGIMGDTGDTEDDGNGRMELGE